MIHVCYGLYDRDGHYAKFCGTSIVSMFENTSASVTVHLLHDSTLTPDNRDKFNMIAGRYNQHIKFYNVDQLAAARIEHIKKALPFVMNHLFSIAALYRLMLPEILSKDIDKIVYLDAGDTMVHLDIRRLWNVSVEEHPIAAFDEINNGPGIASVSMCAHGLVRPENYFNSGVLVMNLNYFRNNPDTIWGANGGFDFYVNHQHVMPYLDQEILNYCFSENHVRLSSDFNCFVGYARARSDRIGIERKLYHFANHKPDLDISDDFNRLYLEYFAKTPWFNADIFQAIVNSIDDRQKRLEMSLVNMTKLLAKNRRAFITDEYNIPPLRALFSIADDELVIIASKPDAIEKLAEALRSFDQQTQGGGEKIRLPHFFRQLSRLQRFSHRAEVCRGARLRQCVSAHRPLGRQSA